MWWNRSRAQGQKGRWYSSREGKPSSDMSLSVSWTDVCSRWYFTDFTMVNRHFQPPFVWICLVIFYNHHRTSNSKWRGPDSPSSKQITTENPGNPRPWIRNPGLETPGKVKLWFWGVCSSSVCWFTTLARCWFEIFKCSSLPGDMIQIDLRIFFRWVGEKPPTTLGPQNPCKNEGFTPPNLWVKTIYNP